MKEQLTRTECTAMRGIAILAIMLHNYCHAIKYIVKENEFVYRPSNNDRLWQMLSHPDSLLPVHLLSYFGHYGVPVFLFLSGFGLVCKYEKTQKDSCPPMRFVRYNYLKLLRMLIVGFSLYVSVNMLTPGKFQYHWDNVLAQLLMYINVLPEPNKIINPGIYWFFGLMMELYIIYRLLLYRRSSWFVVALIAVCWLLQVFSFDPDGDTLNRLRYNFIGAMLPFGLGILMARGQIIRKQFGSSGLMAMCLLGSVALTFVMSFSFHSWLWIPVVIIIGTIALVKTMPQWMLKVFVWFGSISAAIFVAHPIARSLFIAVGRKQDVYDGLMLYVIGVIALSWVIRLLIETIPRPQS